MIDKVGFGLSFFDEKFGGVFRGRPSVCIGRENSGKSIVAYHFANQGIKDDDKVLVISSIPAKDVLILAETYGMDFTAAVQRGQLILLEYARFLGKTDASINVMLPPDSFLELQEIIEAQAISRVVLDPVLPFIAIQPVSRIHDHVFSFINAFERMNVTTLMTMPKPVSNAAFALKKAVEDFCPIVLATDVMGDDTRTIRASKYLGETRDLDKPFDVVFAPGRGLVLKEEVVVAPPAAPERVITAAPTFAMAQRHAEAHAAGMPPPAAPQPPPTAKRDGPIRFSNVVSR